MFPQIFGKYVLERELASGGMARVFVATLRGAGGFEKRLVVKQIRPELSSDAGFVSRFVSEAKTAVELSHPNIVPVYELGVEGGVYFIAMELCPGVTLADLLRAGGALDPAEGAYVGIELCRALDYAHRRAGIVHRDVTPRNVLIDDEGAVRLIDFGIAEPVDADGSEVFGSPGHMPPEQIRGEALTSAVDTFAVGALLLEAWTGKAPFRRTTERESLQAAYEPPPPIGTVVPRLSKVEAMLQRAVDPDPARRPGGIDDLGRALREFVQGRDLVDLARALGTRVRSARRASASEVNLEGTPPGTPVAGSPTRTFATRRLDAGDLGDEVPGRDSTRRLDDGAEAGVTRRVDASGSSDEAPQGPPTTRPLVPSDEEGKGAGSDLPPATDEPQRSPSSERRAGARSAIAVLGGIAVAIAIWMGFTGRAPQGNALSGPSARLQAVQTTRPPPPDGAPATAASAASAAATGREMPAPGEESTKEPDPAALREDRTSPGPAPENAAQVPQAPANGTALHELATNTGVVTLTAAPSAKVRIGGRTLSTPVSTLNLPAGEYSAIFESPTWDGAISAKIVVEPGASRRVHADFTSEPPRVLVR